MKIKRCFYLFLLVLSVGITTVFPVLADTFPDYQLFPIDEIAKYPDFKHFHDQLLTMIANKDIHFLKEHLADDIDSDYSYALPNPGPKEFLDGWNLNQNPSKSKFWAELKKTLQLGCVYNKDGYFGAPYVIERFPEELTMIDYEVIMAKDVPLFQKPDKHSKILAKLSYNIVEASNDKVIVKDNISWCKITTTKGLEGYVNSQYVQSPITYYWVGFRKNKGIWKISFFKIMPN